MQHLFYTTGNSRTRNQALKVPGPPREKPSVSVGFIGDRAWAKCWSHGCSQSDILAALNLSKSPSIPWIPPPAPRPRPTISVETLPPVSPFAASEYLKGILTPSGVKGGEKVYHCGGGIVYHRHDEKGLNWEPGGIRSGAGVRSSGVSQESTGSSDTWEAALCRLCLRR